MNAETTQTENTSSPSSVEHDESNAEWVTPEFVEQSACAEICAYVFSA